MGTLIYLECIKTFRKMRTYISFAAILCGLVLVDLGILLDKDSFMMAQRWFAKDFFITGNPLNAFFVAHLVMMTLLFHIPILIALVAGDQFAGEATEGTLRMIMIRPPARRHIYIAKVVTAFIYSIVLVLFLAVGSLGGGLLLFGRGEMLVFGMGLRILTQQQAIIAFLLAYPLAMLAMMTIAALSLLLSVLVENAIGPIIGTMAVMIVSLIVTETTIPFFNSISPFFFTSYTKIWQAAFMQPIPYNDIFYNAGMMLVYILLFLGAGWIIFNRRDIMI
ncbi:ABC transporter permease subunit [candidate division KSB1 bacterium]|nr:ABC transporter permease subunit [candidate division KSB1 bacterium]